MNKTAIRYLQNILITLFFVISIYLIAINIDIEEIWKQLKQIPGYKLIILALISLSASLLKSIRLKRATKSPLRLDQFSAISFVHNILAVIIPFKLGELSFPLLHKKYSGEEFSKSFAQLIVVRMMDAIFVFAIGMVVVFFFFDDWNIKIFTVFGLLAMVGGLGLLRLDPFVKFIDGIKWLKPISKVIDAIDQTSDRQLLETASFTLVIWFLTYFYAYLLMEFIGVDLGVLGSMVWNTLFALSAAIPFQTPGMVGTAEAIGVFVFEYFGVGNSTATPLELSVLIHAISLGLGSLWGILGAIYLWLFVKPFEGSK